MRLKIDETLTFLTSWNDLTDTRQMCVYVCSCREKKYKFPVSCNILTFSRQPAWLTLPGSQSVPSIGGSSLVLHSASPSTLHHRPAQITCCRKGTVSDDEWSLALSVGQQFQLLWCKQKRSWVKICSMCF